MDRYLAQITCLDGSCFRKNSDDLNVIREWARQLGKPGETLTVMKNGDCLANAKTFLL